MRLSKVALILCTGVISVVVVSKVSAANDPCKVLTAEKFSEVMGYVATTDETTSTKMSCFYTGPGHSGGQFMILSESAGPEVDARLNGRHSAPPAGSGLIGGTYREGTVMFSVSIRSTDRAKLQALVAEIRRNLK
jgi:hypothetical protein